MIKPMRDVELLEDEQHYYLIGGTPEEREHKRALIQAGRGEPFAFPKSPEILAYFRQHAGQPH